MRKQYKDTEIDSSLEKIDSSFLWKSSQKQELKNRLLTDIELIESQGKLKRSIVNGNNIRKKNWTFTIMKYTAAILIISVLTFSSALASPALANFVAKIPVIGNVFNYFVAENDYFEAYQDLSKNIGIVQESSGVEMIIDQAIYDGNMVTLSYIIRTKEKFETPPMFEKLPQVQGEFSNSSNNVEYVKDVGYVGIMTLAMFEDNNKIVNISWKPESISSQNKTIQGDWKFQFSLEEIEGEYIPINEEVSNNGVTVQIIDALKTNVNLSINYSQVVDMNSFENFSYVEAELNAIDNLGNEYKVPYNGGKGIVGSGSSEDILWNATIHGLDKKATSITFYPFAHISNEAGSKRIDFEPITVHLN